MKKAFVSALAVLALLAPSLVRGETLRLKPLKDEGKIRGTFAVIFYGGTHYDDIETLAVLDPEGDEYEVVPRAPDFDYRVHKGLEGGEALREAREFATFHHNASGVMLGEVVDREGRALAYEVRPLYRPLAYGTIDAIESVYWTEGVDRVRFRVNLKPEVERLLHGDGWRFEGMGK